MRFLGKLLLFLASIGFIALVLSVGFVVYIIGEFSKDLPNYERLKDYAPPVVSRLQASDGRLLTEFAEESRIYVPVSEMPPLVKNAFISSEDKNFYSHNGVDYIAIARAVVTNLKAMGSGRRPEGASTITQQVAKNFLLTNEVSYKRKIREAILAYRLERHISKDRILELYLNQIYLGYRSYGVAAAGLNYFDKSLNDLEIHEVAYLAALPKAPNNYHPKRKTKAALARRNWVIDRMTDNGYITSAQGELAKLKPLDVVARERDGTSYASYFEEEVRRELYDRYGEDMLYGGGLSVRTTLDPDLQKIAQKSLRDGLMQYDRRHGYRGRVAHLDNLKDSNWMERLNSIQRQAGMLDEWSLAVVRSVSKERANIGFKDGSNGFILKKNIEWAQKFISRNRKGDIISGANQVFDVGDVIMVRSDFQDGAEKGSYLLRQVPEVQGALVAMDPYTGRVLAMQGGWDFDQSVFNRATQAKRQPGSAFKPFVYSAALEKGFTPAMLVLDAPFVVDQGPHLKKWRPNNYTKEYYGLTPIRIGIEKSRNLMTVRLAEYVGMDTVSEYAARFGVVDNMPKHLANALGSQETTLMRMVRAYSVFVNGGKRVEPTLIDRIQDREGKNIYVHDDRECDRCGPLMRWENQSMPQLPELGEPIMDPRHAYQITSMLEGVVQRGTGVRIRALNRPLAGKTGTTNDYKDAWFVGFSPHMALGVYVGFDEPRSLGNKESGSSVAVPIWKDFMEKALADEPVVPFKVPKGISRVLINRETGARAGPGDASTLWESFLVGSEPDDQMYVLDGRGISAMPAVSTIAPADTGADEYDGNDSDTPPPPVRTGLGTGTGGLY